MAVHSLERTPSSSNDSPRSDVPRWTLEIESEAAYLVPWLDSGPPRAIEDEVLAFIYGRLLSWPWVEGAEHDDSGVFSGYVAGVPIVWLIDEERRVVVLAGLGALD
jgi:hypothetical protein